MRAIRIVASLLAAIVVTGCATTRPGEEETPPEILRVVIQNDGVITQQPRINLVPEGGGTMPILVGRLTTLGVETLTVRRPDLGGTYRLQAQATGGFVLTSPIFSTRGNEQLYWDLRRNTVSVRRLSDGDATATQ
ncbi:MAG TPA: hypothetical protein VF665_14575 [Longimicrobium sp.]|jgi:hypothetical protein|uniref:hypothetical protein n=1 Tax=Longimicrobium sp. TaxID=2029185 RepID=UPI002EDA4213